MAAMAAITEVEWLSEDEQRSWRAFITAITMLQRQLNTEVMSAHDLSLDDYGILSMLSEAEDDRLRFGELAEVLRVPKAHVTYRFRRLASQGLVTREACESDARGAWVVLTPAGRTRVEEAAPTHVASVRRHLLDHMTPEQLEVVGEAMTAVVEAQCATAPHRY